MENFMCCFLSKFYIILSGKAINSGSTNARFNCGIEKKIREVEILNNPRDVTSGRNSWSWYKNQEALFDH